MTSKAETLLQPIPTKNEIVNQVKSILSTINSSSKEANNTLIPILTKLNNNELNVNNGLSILDVKYEMKLMYLTNMAYLIMKKCSGDVINEDNAIQRLVELRTVIERIRPLEQKLKYQIDKYIKIAVKGETDPNDPTNFKPNPSLMDNENEDDSDEDSKRNKKDKKEKKSNIYKAPKLSSVHYDEDETQTSKKERLQARARRRALSSQVMSELAEEYLDRPIEYSHGSSIGLRNKRDEKEIERQNYEETYLTRLPVEKRKYSNQMKSFTLNRIGHEVTAFDNVQALDDAGDDDEDGQRRGKKRKSGGNAGGSMIKGKGKKKFSKGGKGGKKRKFK